MKLSKCPRKIDWDKVSFGIVITAITTFLMWLVFQVYHNWGKITGVYGPKF